MHWQRVLPRSMRPGKVRHDCTSVDSRGPGGCCDRTERMFKYERRIDRINECHARTDAERTRWFLRTGR
jgi:hypothetical protein